MDGLEEGFFRRIQWRAEPPRPGHQSGEFIEPPVKDPAVIDDPITDFRGRGAMPSQRVGRYTAVLGGFVSGQTALRNVKRERHPDSFSGRWRRADYSIFQAHNTR